MNETADPRTMVCLYVYTAWNAVYVLLAPVFGAVIFIGFQQWRKPQSSNRVDLFTFNLAALDMIGVVGACLLTASFFRSRNTPYMDRSGEIMTFMVQCGQILFHNLFCVERYLAVVHPITYLRLKKKENVIKYRCIVAAWLITVVIIILRQHKAANITFFYVLAVASLSLVSITFFCASVLCVLIRPSPGEKSSDKRLTDQSKRRAFSIMAAITLILLLKFIIMFVSFFVYMLGSLDSLKACVMAVFSQWMNAPSSVVLPLIFLHQQITLRKQSRTTQ